MAEKLFLNLTGHKNNKLALKKMVQQADGDIETFRRLYRERFNFAARLFPEDHLVIKDGKELEGVMAIN